MIALTDGMFAHDGSLAPLQEYLEALPEDAWLLIDDSHGFGVLGANGRGSLEATAVRSRRIVQTITLSKAFGVYGGAILGTARLRQCILKRSRLFMGGTPLPLPLANAALRSLTILKSNPDLRKRLQRNTAYVRNALANKGLQTPDTPGPIVTLPPMSQTDASRLRQALLAANIYPPFIKYPGGPAKGYFRFVISSQHTDDQLERLVKTLVQWANR